MNRFGSTQIHDQINGRVSDSTIDGPHKTPARRGLADLGSSNVVRTAEKKKLGLGVSTPSRLAPVSAKLASAAPKKNVIVFEDISPAKEEPEQEDEEIETCAPPSAADRSVFCRSIRDVTILPAENDLLLEEDEESEISEGEEENGGVERYFRPVYNVADKFEEMWNELQVEAHDSDTEVEYCPDSSAMREDDLAAMCNDFEMDRAVENICLVDDERWLEMERRMMEDSSSDEDDFDRSI